MRFLKLAIISIILLVGTVTAISLLLPSTVRVTRGVDINAPVDSVYGRISNLDKWKLWIANRDTLPISVAADKKSFAMGNMKVTLSTSSQSQIKTLWTVNEGTPMVGTFFLATQKDKHEITVQWEFVQHLKWYPWEKFSAAITDKVLGPFMEESLKNLEESMEK